MPIELVVPQAGESITEVEIGEWLKKVGDTVAQDGGVVVIETAKTTFELPAPTAGRITQIVKQTGEVAAIGDVIGYMETADSASPAVASDGTAAPQAAETGALPAKAAPATAAKAAAGSDKKGRAATTVMPAAARALATNKLAVEDVIPSGPGGRLLKEDVEAGVAAATAQAPTTGAKPVSPQAAAAAPSTEVHADEEIVPMTLMRRTIAQRLVEAQQNAALLTTFNEIDMSAAMEMRKQHQEAFTARYGIKLGYMSFFVKAVIDALKQYPAMNAEIRGKNLVYRNHYDIGVAIGSGKGLVVPVLREAQRMSFAEVENSIAEFAARVKNNTLSPEALEGGTFSITNGGIYGSLLSTPIVNPPQSGILGMHSIQERPMAIGGQVVIRPMMYVALTYDHRVVDGREAVSFLKRIKECVENPARMLIEV